MKQGEVGGVLKELGYSEDQVIRFGLCARLTSHLKIVPRSTSFDLIRFVYFKSMVSFACRQIDSLDLFCDYKRYT